MYDPAFPSSPPPPPEKTRPMSYIGAVMWITGTHLGFLWLVFLAIALRETASRDVITQVMCQALAYVMALFLVLRVHAPEASIREFVALRPTHAALYPLGALLGGSIAVPAAWLLGFIEQRFPPPERQFDFIHLFYDSDSATRVLIAVSVVLLGPMLEELLFRGAVFGPLLQDKSPLAVVLVSAALFALVHQEPRRLLPIFAVGLVLGYVRYLSGSLLPAMALHASFNALPFVGLFASDGPPDPAAASEQLEVTTVLIASALALAALAAIFVVGKHSMLAAKARARG
jgi:membrane protease YdiL (CAAX protease family)